MIEFMKRCNDRNLSFVATRDAVGYRILFANPEWAGKFWEGLENAL